MSSREMNRPLFSRKYSTNKEAKAVAIKAAVAVEKKNHKETKRVEVDRFKPDFPTL